MESTERWKPHQLDDPAGTATIVPAAADHLLHVHLGDSDGDPDADLPPGRIHPLGVNAYGGGSSEVVR